MRQAKVGLWAVYLKAIKGCPGGMRAVCRQDEWEALEKAQPGVLGKRGNICPDRLVLKGHDADT
jgi:hypothetical protein